MTPWQTIDAELHRRRLGWQWLADKLGMTIQRVSNWQKRGIPAAHLRSIADALQMTVDQLEGIQVSLAPVSSGWPFAYVSEQRYRALQPDQQGYLQAKINSAIDEIEQTAANKKAA